MDSTEAIVITLLVLVILLIVFQIEVYRKITAIFDFYKPEIAPNASLRYYSTSFLPKE